MVKTLFFGIVFLLLLCITCFAIREIGVNYVIDSVLGGASHNTTITYGQSVIGKLTGINYIIEKGIYYIVEEPEIISLSSLFPTIYDFYCINCNSKLGDSTEPYTTLNHSALVMFTTISNAKCSFSHTNSSFNLCETTNVLNHTCRDNGLFDYGNNYVYLNCSNIVNSTIVNYKRYLFNFNISEINYNFDFCDDITNLYFQLKPNNYTGYNISPDGQIHDNCTFNITNTDIKNGTVKMYLSYLSSNHSMFAKENCDRNSAINLTTSSQIINKTLQPNMSVGICLWMDFMNYVNYTFTPNIYLEVLDKDES